MIDDRMTFSNPVEELCLFASKETLARCASPVPMITGVEEAGCSKSGAFIWTVTSQEVRSYPVSWLFRNFCCRCSCMNASTDDNQGQ
ncbi:hypothetical protein CHARACLAT_022480 [Characodon lateralis]|uniref:Uncharacterized protein n=1 Tax=Characodon lateralis TaxID=208331 RepID=A0ABU7EXD1_9TELE|nr:hypothetical protein [Characodon lateralis]